MNIALTQIDKDEVLRYLGYKGSVIPEDIHALVDRSMEEIMKLSTGRTVRKVFALEGRMLRGTNFQLLGDDIMALLADCKEVIFFAVTLGIAVDQTIKSREVRELEASMVLDCAASAAIEGLCDTIQADLIREYRAKGLYLTDRYSPGYGDMPLEQQNAFCSILDTARRIGLQVSRSGLMIPRKSVTAIVGISDTPQKSRGRGCENCSFYPNCKIRKEGKYCGK